MATIAAIEARGLFTKMLIDIFRETPAPTSFLRSFFTVKESATKYISIEVERGTERVASDVLRGSDGNRNIFPKSTERVYEPPYYREYFNATELEVYDRMFGRSEVDELDFQTFLEEVARKLIILTNKIRRRYELQCAQALQDGVVTLISGDNISFDRKAASLVDYSANPWTNDANSPYADLEKGCTFLRTVGKCQGGIFNAILGSEALGAFTGNAKVLARGPMSNVNFDSLRAPQRDSVGGNLHGMVTAGSYQVRIWSYPEFYENDNGISVPYIDPKKIIMLPEAARFTLAFAAAPQLITVKNPKVIKGAFVYNDYIDEKSSSHEYDVKSAGVAILTAVDQAFTAKVIGG
jgi:hypothetical protein